MPKSRQFIALGEAKAPFFAGVDLGGTNIKVGVVDDLGRPMSWTSIETLSERGAEDAVGRMAKAVKVAIDEAGLKGTRRGGAGISELHANFIVNHGGAKAADVLGLLDLARAAVLKRTGIALELEIKLVGFPEGVHEEHPA